ncbi:FumA C-terminus/TtdB family hydratase beta subunit [Pseudothermotoga thermarum]|uniref:Hydro-lyase, Fe-S type, tartrate/fumarate subfamily, beta subunit n=1 Tax=Pseudothermotoga thermarum DSM 5069 TaxID=688269 RepID=F7YW16_9THEM|nr:FumA C-terminus/TtdB family hydratase beta subunit [Pseudothermotoga thermarum]AEH50503.1 hydro-lyase, Fe-S type, tartrate/fumarate subfamily, beta subunit [Pseudothermotoga thermarum DSM 5069]
MLNFLSLNAGDYIRYSGEFLVMRDAAQKRIRQMLKEGRDLPIDLSGKIVFYAGPAKSKDGKFSIGPTTSARMDQYLQMLFELGVVATVGKGKRSKLACELCAKFRRVYFVAPSGAAAALSQHVDSILPIAFEDLGPEAIYLLKVKDFPLIVAIDSNGQTIFELKDHEDVVK